MSEDSDDLAKRLHEMFAPEPLHPDLADYLRPHATLGKVLQHPLVYSVPYIEPENKRLNAFYLLRRKELESARKISNWSRFVFLHERPYRLDAFSEIVNNIEDDAAYWKLLASIWTDSENIVQNFDQWVDLWTPVDRIGIEATMDEDELNALKALPDEIVVYRGYGHPDGVNGLSWTTNKERAQWFARRRVREGHKPHLAEGLLHKDRVLAYFLGRNESEVVVLPENVVIQKTTVVRRER